MSAVKSEKTMELVIGKNSFVLNLPESTIEIADWDASQTIDIFSEVEKAFDQPIDFPPLSQAIVADDRVAIAIEPGLPHTMAIVDGVVQYLLKNAVRPESITVLLAQEHESLSSPMAAMLEERAGAAIDVRYHHGQDPDSMGYLAAAQGAEPIYIDRALLEADVVLPITCARDPKAWAYAGLYGIVPWFTDSKTQQRWRLEYAKETRGDSEKRLRAAKEVAWLLGIQPVLAVVPGSQGNVDSFFFGNAETVERSIESAMAPRSITPSSQLVDLVVCSIDGDHDQQTWDNVARVLDMAEHFLGPSGTVVVASELREKPGPVFRWLSSMEDSEKTERHLLNSPHPQALAAIEIYRSLSKRSVYLMSEISREKLEEFGIGAVADIAELEHLIASHATSLVISGAQHRRVNRT
jgi:Lactate racemase N-terminal domain